MNTDKIFAEAIANEYAPKDTSRVIALKKLDRKAKLPATIFAYTFGIIGTLVAGFGMCLSMQVIGTPTTATMAAGIIIGILGFLAVSVNYPIYRRVLKKGKEKYAFEIVELAKEISEE
ncbi:MAG: dihydropteridine reductase [Clostridiales bacterium]|nr:dihydropteridine reductase [Clostridiales bacterium]